MRRWLLPAVAGLAAFALLFGAPYATRVFHREPPRAVVEEVAGEVRDGDVPLVARALVDTGDRVTLSDGARLTIVFPRGARLTAQGPAAFDVVLVDPPRLSLDDGRLAASGDRLRVDTRHVTAELRGDATVEADAARTTVAVEKGAAALTSPKGQRSLGAGERATFP